MRKILLHGTVGEEIQANRFVEELDGGSGDVEIDMLSGGGRISQGAAIMNAIRLYDKGKVIARIHAVGSMMTAIAMSADEIEIFENSSFFIHNAQGFAYGDSRALSKSANVLEGYNKMYAGIYAKRSGNTVKEVRKMMDEGTLLLGEDILKKGFADRLIKTEKDGSMETVDILSMVESANKEMEKEDLALVQAELKACLGNCDLNANAEEIGYNEPKPKPTKRESMNLQEFQANHPELYSQVFNMGVSEEQQRAEAHLTMGEASGAMDLAVACIKDGSGLTTALNAKYMAAGMKRNEIQARDADNPSADLGATPPAGDNVDMASAVAKQLGVELDG